MKKLVSLSFAWILFFASQLWAAAWDQHLPMQTAEDKAEAFLKIRAMIPSMADGAVRYGFDPITLFNHQLEIEKMVSADSQYQTLKPAHKDLVEMTLYDGNAQPAVASDKEVNWKAWQERSAQLVHSWGLNSDADVMAEIQKTLQSPLLGKTQGIVVGLSNLVPGPMKKDFFSASIEAKIEILNQHLPAEVISHGFSPAKLGWTDTEISKEEIISRLKAASTLEQRLNVLLVYHYSQQKDLAAPKDYLNKWTLEAAQKKTLDQWFNGNVAKMIPTETAQAEPSLIVREIPPAVSMFRGFAGNDCSTLCSFPFVNSPNEYTFLIYDSKGGIKGYAQGTKVLVNGESTFFLHTIAGPRISKADALNVIKAFVQEKQSFGFNEILLPPMEKVEGLINFVPVREAVREVITASAKPMQYQDAELRTSFKTAFKITKTYDDAASNPFGYQIDESKLGAPVKLVHKETAGLDKIQTQMDKNSLIGMLLTMGKDLTKNKAMIEALVPHAGVNFETAADLIRLSSNKGALPSAEFIAMFEQHMKDSGFTFKEGYFKKNISLVARGLLNSPDVIGHLQQGEPVLMNLLEQREFQTVETFLTTNPSFFRSSTLTKAFLRAFYNDIHEAIFRQPTALLAALRVNPSAILQDKEILEMLVKSPKALEALSDYAYLNPRMAQLIDKQTGRAVLEGRKKRSDLFDQIIREARAAKTDAEYMTAIKKVRKQMPDLAWEVWTSMDRNLRMVTVDQAVSLGHGQAAVETFRDIFTSKPDMNDPNVLRALRKLLPAALKNATWELDSTMSMTAKLRSLCKDTAEFDRVVTSALAQRSDSAALAEKYKAILPDLNWGRVTAVRCEALFL